MQGSDGAWRAFNANSEAATFLCSPWRALEASILELVGGQSLGLAYAEFQLALVIEILKHFHVGDKKKIANGIPSIQIALPHSLTALDPLSEPPPHFKKCNERESVQRQRAGQWAGWLARVWAGSVSEELNISPKTQLPLLCPLSL